MKSFVGWCIFTCYFFCYFFVVVDLLLLLSWSLFAWHSYPQLLEKAHSNRLGSSGPGCEDIRVHPFFKTVNWNHLEKGILEPPFKPNVSH